MINGSTLCKSTIPHTQIPFGIDCAEWNYALTERYLLLVTDSHGVAVGYGISSNIRLFALTPLPGYAIIYSVFFRTEEYRHQSLLHIPSPGGMVAGFLVFGLGKGAGDGL
ncbi:MAG: hypothetical protein ACYDBB_06335 [Armatimonadota bacterium]